MKLQSNNLVFFSSGVDIWGGSEELWAQSAAYLAQSGYRIHIFKFCIDSSNPRIKKLRELGCRITDLNEYIPAFGRRIWNRFLPHNSYRTLPIYIKKYLAREINKLQPKLIVISQGDNHGSFQFLQFCSLDKIPYVVISQKAVESYWVDDWDRDWIIKGWQNSVKNYFVSQHNQTLTEEQYGIRMENAEIIRNPFLTQVDEALPWEFSASGNIRLACVGRLFPLDKGQDILLRVFSDKKWRERNIELSFFGKGEVNVGLKDLARLFGLKNVVFNGHISDITSIWKNHQALVLPSRNEGLPLALVEAMLCGRTAIVTDVGGNKEVLENNITGFIAKSVDEAGVDEALERAWQRVEEWEQIGKLAAKEIRKLVPSNPAQVFAEKLIALLDKEKVRTDEI